jgi:NAD(P)-dependent dehydrogenase (short-subunit alcohol dehydrogenase family)
MSDTLDMELSPLGIRVFLLCPGYVKTQLAANDVATLLPPNSLYGPWRENIRQNEIGVKSGMPVDQFARKVVDGALASTPARYMSIGTDVGIVSFFRWMPRSFQLFMTSFKFGKPMKAADHHTEE